MEHHENGSASLKLAEIIRVNQLVRGHIDFDGFKQWYDSLSSVAEQSALVGILIEFACQAGFGNQIYKEAISAAQVNADDPVVRLLASPDEMYDKIILQGYQDGYSWLMELSDSDRFTLFRLSVYLFGKAEGKRYQECDREKCSAWWHRDLLDERVVQAILNDPDYYKTSPKNDDSIKRN